MVNLFKRIAFSEVICVLDPPRGGLGPKAINHIRRNEAITKLVRLVIWLAFYFWFYFVEKQILWGSEIQKMEYWIHLNTKNWSTVDVRSKSEANETEQLKTIQIKKYCGDLKSGLVWISNGQKQLGCKWSGFWRDLKSGSPTIWNPVKWQPFYQKPFEIQTKMFGFRMVGAIWNLTFKKLGFQIFPDFK